MKRPPDAGTILAFGAHPDDVEFGCGAVLAKEALLGRKVAIVVCSRGESASRGTPAIRTKEARQAAREIGASVSFLRLDGDARLEIKVSHALAIAALIRRHRPAAVLAPSLAENQHPDHRRLGRLVRDAARLARYGGLKALKAWPSHAIGALLYYATSPEAEPAGEVPVVIDVSEPAVMAAWNRAMRAHRSQLKTRDYPDLQVARARVLGLRSGVAHAQGLYPADPLVFPSLGGLASARRF